MSERKSFTLEALVNGCLPYWKRSLLKWSQLSLLRNLRQTWNDLMPRRRGLSPPLRRVIPFEILSKGK